MEEEVGFEPTERVNVRQFSRLLQSTALALLHSVVGYIIILLPQNFLSTTLLANLFFTRFILSMKIQKSNHHCNNIHFSGLDARKLKGFVMNSNFAGIADEMKNIGELENFKVFLFERKPINNIQLSTDKFEINDSHKGCWAQDFWGIVKNSLLSFEQSEKSDMLQKVFKLKTNPFQDKIHKENNIPEVQEYVDILYNLPQLKRNGKDVVAINTPDGVSFIDKKIYDAEFRINSQILKNLYNKTHVKGGNYFLTKNPDGSEELLIGQSELKKLSVDELKQMFMTDKVHIIPQADFHLDLFIRPLNDKKVLIADDQMMLGTLEQGFKKLEKLIISTPREQREQLRTPFMQLGTYFMGFKEILQKNPYAPMQEVEKTLINAGYKPIKVPGRLFEIEACSDETGKNYILKHCHNYLNANAHINDKNELIYITNKSSLDDTLELSPEFKEKFGFSFEQAFLDAVKPHVDKVYFVSGKNNVLSDSLLPNYNGGIHCMCMEIPE